MSDDVFATRPPKKCPKCGHAYGFAYSTPTYESGVSSAYHGSVKIEALTWGCRYCGYEITTPTADAPKPADDWDPRVTSFHL